MQNNSTKEIAFIELMKFEKKEILIFLPESLVILELGERVFLNNNNLFRSGDVAQW